MLLDICKVGNVCNVANIKKDLYLQPKRLQAHHLDSDDVFIPSHPEG